MNLAELRLALRPLPFLDAHAGDPRGVLALRPQRLLAWHPALVEQVFRADRSMRHLPSRVLTPLLGTRSLLWAAGERHAAYRKVLTPLLHGRGLAARRTVVADTIHAEVDALPSGSALGLIGWTRRVTLRIIGGLLLDRVDGALLDEFAAWLDGVLGSRARTLAARYLRLGRHGHGREDLDARLLAQARSQHAPGPTPPAIAALLAAPDGPLGGLDDDELRDQVVSLLFAGHETTASATAWVLQRLGADPELRGDVLAELAAGGGDACDPARVPLLEAVCQEVLRISPPAIIAGKRLLTADQQVAGLRLRAGTVVTPCIYLAHRDPDVFPHPARFDPRRFLGRSVPRRHYFPFGGGIRHCLGSELAALEMRMIAAALLRRFDLLGTPAGQTGRRARGPAMTVADHVRITLRARSG